MYSFSRPPFHLTPARERTPGVILFFSIRDWAYCISAFDIPFPRRATMASLYPSGIVGVSTILTNPALPNTRTALPLLKNSAPSSDPPTSRYPWSINAVMNSGWFVAWMKATSLPPIVFVYSSIASFMFSNDPTCFWYPMGSDRNCLLPNKRPITSSGLFS